MILIYEKHPPFACIHTNIRERFALIRVSYAFIRERYAFIRESFSKVVSVIQTQPPKHTSHSNRWPLSWSSMWQWFKFWQLTFTPMYDTRNIFCILKIDFLSEFPGLLQRFHSTPWLHSGLHILSSESKHRSCVELTFFEGKLDGFLVESTSTFRMQ